MNSNYIVYKGDKILRTGSCPPSMLSIQARPGEKVIEGIAKDHTQKMQGNKVVDKTAAEIEADNPTPQPIPEDEKQKHIKKKDWDGILARLEALEP